MFDVHKLFPGAFYVIENHYALSRWLKISLRINIKLQVLFSVHQILCFLLFSLLVSLTT